MDSKRKHFHIYDNNKKFSQKYNKRRKHNKYTNIQINQKNEKYLYNHIKRYKKKKYKYNIKNNINNNVIIKIIILIFLILLFILLHYTLYSNDFLNKKIRKNMCNENNNNIYLKKFKKMKKVVYTANLGKYDEIKTIPKEVGWDYINIIDWNITEEEKNNSNWTFIIIPDYINNMNITKSKKQRFIKLHPHLFFKKYELSLYIDSIYILLGNLNNLIIRVLSPNINIMNLEHRTRNNIHDEFKQVLLLGKDKKEMIQKIKEKYKAEKFPDNLGLGDNSIILRRHNEKNCINLMEKWWEEIKSFSSRDQISFGYVLWKEKQKIKYIAKNFVFKFFERIPHK